MDRKAQVARAVALRGMHDRKKTLLLPNAWDAGSARLFAARGARAIATTSGGVAWALGYADGEKVPLDEVLAMTRRIVRVVNVPVSVDFETGYGATPAEVTRAVGAVIAAGAAGVNIEDSTPGHGPLRTPEDAAARVRAARAAADSAGVPIVINARADNWMHDSGDAAATFADAVARARAYLAAGADCIYPIGLRDAGTIGRFVRAIDAPVNVMGGAQTPPLAELQKLGVARVSTATWLAALALGSADRAVRAMLGSGTFASLATDFGYLDAQRLFAAG